MHARYRGPRDAMARFLAHILALLLARVAPTAGLVARNSGRQLHSAVVNDSVAFSDRVIYTASKDAYEALPGVEELSRIEDQVKRRALQAYEADFNKRVEARNEATQTTLDKANEKAILESYARARKPKASTEDGSDTATDIPCVSTDGLVPDYEKCLVAMMWIRNNGFKDPYTKYYASFGLNGTSTLHDFHRFLFEQGDNDCPLPCPQPDEMGAALVHGAAKIEVAVNNAKVQESNDAMPDPGPGSSYTSTLYAVLSAAGNVDRRKAIRRAHVGIGKGIVLRFFLCEESIADDENDDDIVLMDCEEGSHPAYLTLKTKDIMQVFNRDHDLSLLVISEDDTFVAWNRFRRFLHNLSPARNPAHYYNAYMGVPQGAGHPVNRIPQSEHFQSQENFPNASYPTFMEGAFVVLGRELVRQIVESGVADKFPINIADVAIGVWVDRLKQANVDVKYVTIPGPHKIGDAVYLGCNRTWEEYPYIIHHGMEPEEIQCLAMADREHDPKRAIEPCFPGCRDRAPILEDELEVDKKSLGPADR